MSKSSKHSITMIKKFIELYASKGEIHKNKNGSIEFSLPDWSDEDQKVIDYYFDKLKTKNEIARYAVIKEIKDAVIGGDFSSEKFDPEKIYNRLMTPPSDKEISDYEARERKREENRQEYLRRAAIHDQCIRKFVDMLVDLYKAMPWGQPGCFPADDSWRNMPEAEKEVIVRNMKERMKTDPTFQAALSKMHHDLPRLPELTGHPAIRQDVFDEVFMERLDMIPEAPFTYELFVRHKLVRSVARIMREKQDGDKWRQTLTDGLD